MLGGASSRGWRIILIPSVFARESSVASHTPHLQQTFWAECLQFSSDIQSSYQAPAPHCSWWVMLKSNPLIIVVNGVRGKEWAEPQGQIITYCTRRGLCIATKSELCSWSSGDTGAASSAVWGVQTSVTQLAVQTTHNDSSVYHQSS